MGWSCLWHLTGWRLVALSQKARHVAFGVIRSILALSRCPVCPQQRPNGRHFENGRIVPGRDSCTAAKHPHIRDGSEHSVMRQTTCVNYSMTSSARTRTSSGTSRPSALAVLMLIMNSIFVGCSTGRSPGFAPLRTLATMTADCRHISARPGP